MGRMAGATAMERTVAGDREVDQWGQWVGQVVVDGGGGVRGEGGGEGVVVTVVVRAALARVTVGWVAAAG